MRTITRLAVAATFMGALSASPAPATPAINLTVPGVEYGGGLYTLGFEFSVSSATSITQLGVYDNLSNGLTAPASIGLWDTSGNLLTSANIGVGEGTLDGLFRYTTITPFALTAGTNYVIGAYTTDLASSLGTGQGGVGTVDPLVTIYWDRFSNFNSSFSFPSETNSNSGGAWLGANFQFAVAAVPEPGTWAMMLVGFGIIGYGLRRRRQFVRVRFG